MQGAHGNRDKYIHIDATEGKHTHTMIFLHGLGDSAEGFSDMFEKGGPLHFANMRVVLPTAPRKPVSCNDGYVMNSWFDIFKLADGHDDAGLDMLKAGKTQELM